MPTGKVAINETDADKYAATHSITEDTFTKEIQRVNLNDSAGVDLLGSKTDAKSVATDTTAVSGISIWKQISASVQAIVTALAGTLTVATHAVTGSGNFASTVADGANVTLGAKADDKSTATDITAITAMSVWKQISASVQAIATALAGTLTVASHAVTNAGTFAVQSASTLAAETTKVIGTVNISAAQTIAAVTAISNALPAGTNAIGKLAANSGVDIGDIDVTSIIPGTAANNLGKAEDGAHTTGDVGVMALAVRQDSQLAFAADGDYVPFSIDANGALRVTGGGGGMQYTEDAAAAADPVGNMMLAVRRDTLSASEVSADGDNVAVKATSKGQLHVAAHIFDSTGTEIDWAPGYQVTKTVDVTRAANTTTYAINDNFGSTDTGGYTITGAARVSGGSGIITDIIISFEEDAATPLQGEIVIFDTAITAVADNAAFVVSDAEAKTLVARIPFTLSDFGNNGTAHLQNLNIGFTTVGSANLRFAVIAKNGYVPTTNSSVLTPRFKIMHTT